MGQITFLLLGITLAAAVMAALIFSLGRAVMARATLRRWHLGLAGGYLLAMAALSLAAPGPTAAAGAALILLGLGAFRAERGWNRLFPLGGAIFGALLLLGLPFAGS